MTHCTESDICSDKCEAMAAEKRRAADTSSAEAVEQRHGKWSRLGEAVVIENYELDYEATPTTTTIIRMENTTFLDLPLELRNEVYHYVLEDLVQPPEHPLGPCPSNGCLSPYLRCNRQVSSEIGSLFTKEYLHRFFFYFDNVSELYDCQAKVEERPTLGDMRFRLTGRKDIEIRYRKDDLIRRCIADVIRSQPGFPDKWRFPLISYDPNQAFPYPSSPAEGFISRRSTRETRTFMYLMEVFCPDGANSLCVKAYAWDKHAFSATFQLTGSRHYAVECVVLEGKLCDLQLDDYDIERDRWRLAWQRGELDLACISCDGELGLRINGSDDGLDRWA